MTQEKANKVLMAKPGIDGHWVGIITVSRALRDAGIEVVYGGNMTPAEIAETALQEDVDVVGLSSLIPSYMTLVSDTFNELENRGLKDIPIVLGGTILAEDVPALKKMGVIEVFRPGSPLADIVKFFREAKH